MSVQATSLGFPYIGAQRQLKKHVEAFWAGKMSEELLYSEAKKLREEHWKVQQAQGTDVVTVGDFTFYDRVLDTAYDFGVVPQRYQDLQPGFEQYFAMARGLQRSGIDVRASEMKKWFDTNYHFIVPEFEREQSFRLQSTRLADEFKEAKALGLQARPVVLGPISFLQLGKPAQDPFPTLSLLAKLLPVYVDLLEGLGEAGANWVQMDEPILVFDNLSEDVKKAFEEAYLHLHQAFERKPEAPRLLLATYFGQVVTDVLSRVKDFVGGIHIDLVCAPEQLDSVLSLVEPAASHTLLLSLGLVNGRNVWKNNLAASLELAKKAVSVLGKSRVLIAPSCSLVHSPFSLEFEKGLKKDTTHTDLIDWLAFAVEKCHEVALLAKALNEGELAVHSELESNARSLESRRRSELTNNTEVRLRVSKIEEAAWHRASPFSVRSALQHEKLQLPPFPTTTIGSFPQTAEIRVMRQKYFKGDASQEEYDAFIHKEIEKVVRFQESIGLDVLVHGESERNDMVEHFGHLLHGYAFTENGWVVSYGSRCVKPPIVYGDVLRRGPMTVTEIAYAQSLTNKPMKGMLTGPVTMLKWSFVRDDIPTSELCKQVALALRDEVRDLEAAGIPCIQVDEPAIREGLPLRSGDWAAYLDWSVACFRLSTACVKDETQIHTHMCYSDFNDIFDAIQELDADVLTIENSKSDMKLLKIFETKRYSNEIGPGVYDIHSPRVPTTKEMLERVECMLKYIPEHQLWINPDCGLKSRRWKEVEAALHSMVEVAKGLRAKQGQGC